jgi:hypothetical protein
MPHYRPKRVQYVAEIIMGWYTDMLKRREDMDEINFFRFLQDQVKFQGITNEEYTRLIKSLEHRMEKTVTLFYQEILYVNRDHPESLELDIPWDIPLPSVRTRMLQKIKDWAKDPRYKLSEMERLARDGQNIHTGPVNVQTNENLEKLSKTAISDTQRTLPDIYCAWYQKGYTEETIFPVYEDMKKWGNTANVIKKNDYLYRNTLRSAWAKINTYEEEIRKELVQRLWEECREAVGMCAQGHISRLANVFVGFDLDMKPKVCRTTFQDSIAAIASSEKTVEEKITAAQSLMDEYAIPQDERASWLDAIEG